MSVTKSKRLWGKEDKGERVERQLRRRGVREKEEGMWGEGGERERGGERGVRELCA